VLRGVNLDVGRGETVGLVGESGSGKSMTALSVLHLLPPGLKITGGQITFDGQDVLSLDASRLRALRGGRIAMIFQDPLRHLNPAFTVGEQLEAAIRAHHPRLARAAVRERAVALFSQVHITDPAQRLRSYPHQFSGGMAQRAMIAMALSGEPDLLLADEPTSALDVTVQAEILRLLRRIARERGMAVLFISHNLGAVWQLCDRAAVMYAGEVVEVAPTDTLVERPEHPYTQALLRALPTLRLEQPDLAPIPGAVPPLNAMPLGCAFHPRCGYVRSTCSATPPESITVSPEHSVRCVLPATGRPEANALLPNVAQVRPAVFSGGGA